MNKIKFILMSFMTILIISACTSKQIINPEPNPNNKESIKELAQKEIYRNNGYEQGKRDGFNDGVMWTKQSLGNFMKKIHAIQFSSYLYKNKYIQPGPVYISADNKLTLSKMEMHLLKS